MMLEVAVEVIRGKSEQWVYYFSEEQPIMIGRETYCNIVLREKSVSPHHCTLQFLFHHFDVRDNDSKTGTFVIQTNEDFGYTFPLRVEKKNSVSLKNGDTILLGRDCELRVHLIRNHARHRCEVCGQEFLNEDPEASICESCLGDHSKMVEYLVQRMDRIRGVHTRPAFPGYETIGFLGAGATGEAWVLADAKDGSQVVCKNMTRVSMLSAAKREQFQLEVRLTAQLSHPNVIRMIGSGELERVPYHLTEFCCTGSISSFVQRKRQAEGGRLERTTATHILLQLLDALDYLHSARIALPKENGEMATTQGIVHRDVNPKNIFLMDETEYPLIKLADFGYAKAREPADQPRSSGNLEFAGTLDFMPRLRTDGVRYDESEVDVWSAAATYYSMLTGHPPKHTSEGRCTALASRTGSARPIREWDPDLPIRLAEAIDFALEETGDRLNIHSARELKALIEGAL